ncbi:MAG: class I SAM-dependent methyltransferase [Blastocatellia bacterium]|nr:class I SAM-dependent methyltransferase [Blastocatellia bacterium]
MSTESLQPLADAMKRDWDDRAREDSRWYINTIKRNQNDEEFDATGRLEVENFILAEPLIVRGRDLKQARLLEIGCGIGRMTRHLAGLFGEVHGTDVSAEMIRQAQERFRDAPNAFFHATNGLDFSIFPDAHFDVVFSVYVFQHVPTPEIVRANIRDACRVLKPGGVFKFQVCGIDHPDYERMRKDTWTGTPFSERELRAAARENGVRCLSLHGLGTQYCWAVFEKPIEGAAPAAPVGEPRIVAFGRTDDPDRGTIPTNGDSASLTLIVSGLDPAADDINSVFVEIDGEPFLPHYLGPVREVFGARGFDADVLQLDLFTSPRMPCGLVDVLISDARGESSNIESIELLEPQPIPPRIHMINNAVDGGIDIHAQGEKSVFRVFATGMDETAGTGNVRVQLNDRKLTPESVTFLPANGFYLTIARMPLDAAPGEADVRIHFNDLASAPARILILA